MKNKGFDYVQMKREAAKRIYEEIKHMSLEEEVAYWAARTEALKEEQKRLREKAKAA